MTAKEKTFKNSNTPLPMKKGKGRLIKISWGKHEEEIKKIWQTKPTFKSGSLKSKMAKIQKLVGYSSNLPGFCCQCKALNQFLIKYRMQGITIIERYCQEHVP